MRKPSYNVVFLPTPSFLRGGKNCWISDTFWNTVFRLLKLCIWKKRKYQRLLASLHRGDYENTILSWRQSSWFHTVCIWKSHYQWNIQDRKGLTSPNAALFLGAWICWLFQDNHSISLGKTIICLHSWAKLGDTVWEVDLSLNRGGSLERDNSESCIWKENIMLNRYWGTILCCAFCKAFFSFNPNQILYSDELLPPVL